MTRGGRGAPVVSAGLATRPGQGAPDREPGPLARWVLALAATVPSGSATTYGEIAEALGVPRGARAVGNAMRDFGHDVPWWRVVRADGSPPRNAPVEALERLREEGCPLVPDGSRVDLRRALHDLPPTPEGLSRAAVHLSSTSAR